MATTKTIRSVERAIDVLKVMNGNSAMTLSQIAAAVSLPKSTALRIVLTLQQGGLVRRGLADGLYRISTDLTLRAPIDAEAERIAEVGAPELDRVRHLIGWPADLAVRRGAHMVAIESSRNQSPFASSTVLARLGDKINMLASASGRAYLAHCPDEERLEILAAAGDLQSVFSRLADNEERFDADMADIRALGYARRAEGFKGQSCATGDQHDDGLESIAVPVKSATAIYGSLILFWSRPAATVEEMVDRYLLEIQASANRIADGMDDFLVSDIALRA